MKTAKLFYHRFYLHFFFYCGTFRLYLFINPSFFQNVFQRKARYALREETAGHEAETLEKAMVKFDSVKLDHDDDYLRGARRLKYLKLKKG